MQITRNSLATFQGPSDWFTGVVYVDTVATPSAPSRLGAASVHFAPGARTAGHTHPLGQTLYVTEGIGLRQRHGGPSRASVPVTASTSRPANPTGTAPHPTAS
jgi:quercetin dioxygenase-like cupin family protein